MIVGIMYFVSQDTTLLDEACEATKTTFPIKNTKEPAKDEGIKRRNLTHPRVKVEFKLYVKSETFNFGDSMRKVHTLKQAPQYFLNQLRDLLMLFSFVSTSSMENMVLLGELKNALREIGGDHSSLCSGVIRDCVSKHLYSSAIFFADKVAAVTGEPADVYMQAQALYLGRHHRRAFHLLNASQIVLRDLRFRYLAAKCLEELKEWDQCLLMLGDAKVDEHGNVSDTKACNTMYLDKEGEDRDMNITSAICFLRGKAYEALENRAQARQWYKAAIKADPLCYEALECLLEKHMLTSEEERSLLSSLQFGPEDGWLSLFYSCLIKKYDKESIVEAKFRELEQEDSNIKPSEQSFVCTLKNNTDLLACKAEYYHQCGEYQKCFELTSILLEKDPFHLKCMLVHLAAAMELGQSNELYLLACNLVKDYPQKLYQSRRNLSSVVYCIWEIASKSIASNVGLKLSNINLLLLPFPSTGLCHGLLSVVTTIASRSMINHAAISDLWDHKTLVTLSDSKATSLDGTFPLAWIGYGNAYAAQEEGDQAMSAYRTAARLFPGCHLPTLYIGMEYMRSHSFKLAEQFFMQAKTICSTDPLVYNELGVVAYHMKEYKKSVWWFENTLAHVPSSLSEMWEPTVVNLAHALRKLKYREAITYYEKALALSSRSLSTYAGLAYTYHLQ
ncbi:hypothetical protein RJ639_041792, partial [Escallonia herrerae]